MALDRQGLADAVWSDYVTARFSNTGDPRALQFLYPYLNRGDCIVRLRAIGVAARVFHGRGPGDPGDLDFFTRNNDPFIRDRAVQVVGATVAGWAPHAILETLAPYLGHRNQFIRREAMTALSRAAFGSGNPAVLTEIRRIADGCALPERLLHLAIARVYAGQPTDEAFSLVARTDAVQGWRATDLAVGIMLRGASDAWIERGCREFFEPRLRADPAADDAEWTWGDFLRKWPQFLHRGATEGLCRAAPGGGMGSLNRMLHLRHVACTAHSLMSEAPGCFAEADTETNAPALLELLRTGDVAAQRIAAACLGTLLAGSRDDSAVSVLRDLCSARNKAVAAGAIEALGKVTRSTCGQDMRARCLKMAQDPETARAAIRALGLVFQGSGRSDILTDIRERAEAYRHRRQRGRRRYRPLVACYRAIGDVYHGTGSMEPVDFLLDGLAMSRSRHCLYRWAIGRSLVMIEFPPGTIARTLEAP